MKAVEDAHPESGETEEEQIREHDAVEVDGFVPTGGVCAGKGLDDLRREDHAEDGDDGEDEGGGPEEPVGKVPKFLFGAIAHEGGKDGNHGGGDGPFAD